MYSTDIHVLVCTSTCILVWYACMLIMSSGYIGNSINFVLSHGFWGDKICTVKTNPRVIVRATGTAVICRFYV